ncbi:5-amino-6-(5-phosphoribosylamino)uracil reductase [Methanocalculus taiwanensis]|uniref:5-amino-6-(5-phosphoribosylamino)uracil reductase n=1 Tax=Methanocalculus taiwanensis TaxID=106207 RepID=A0ABD4TIT6_9EURY|nr:dihydrofolate reductase family protein [Methanocalculus taiwanensis]MCQ1538843.1 5-amino-6-(5-phosphoribosylamino)uracil reductase [Methanocalculus taiwanensis]
MPPKVIIHSSVSLDHAIFGYDIDIGLHYSILGEYAPDAVLVGSNTARLGVEMFSDSARPEMAADLVRPHQVCGDPRPIGVFVDSRGVLSGFLHLYRQMEHIRDVVVLVSEQTPDAYLQYLSEREYPYIRCGKDYVDIRAALKGLERHYSVQVIVSDSGADLNNHLIRSGIADEISLILAPVIAGDQGKRLFTSSGACMLDLIASRKLDLGRVHLRYALRKETSGT